MKIKGKVVSGLGEGASFIAIPQYKRGFEKILGFTPFEGTLNLEISREDAKRIYNLKKNTDLVVQGFDKDGRTYYKIKCIRASISGYTGAIIFPLKSHHPDTILEFITDSNLRESLGLSDYSYLVLELE